MLANGPPFPVLPAQTTNSGCPILESLFDSRVGDHDRIRHSCTTWPERQSAPPQAADQREAFAWTANPCRKLPSVGAHLKSTGSCGAGFPDP
jgi:hypothetical protein